MSWCIFIACLKLFPHWALLRLRFLSVIARPPDLKCSKWQIEVVDIIDKCFTLSFRLKKSGKCVKRNKKITYWWLSAGYATRAYIYITRRIVALSNVGIWLIISIRMAFVNELMLCKNINIILLSLYDNT